MGWVKINTGTDARRIKNIFEHKKVTVSISGIGNYGTKRKEEKEKEKKKTRGREEARL